VSSRSVIVVGAGFAGLAAADRLAAEGWRVTVLEARERVGGRVWSSRLGNGALIELGGEFITGGYDVTAELCSRFGIELDGMEINYPDRDLVPDPGLAAGALAAAAERVAALAADDPDAPLLELLAKAADGPAREVLEMRLQSALAFPAAELDSRFARKLPELAATEETRRMRGGNQGLAEAVASALGGAVRLGSPARAIRHGEGGVRVLTDGGWLEAAACVVAVPVALLGDIRFDPPLPAATADAVASIRIGAAAKLAVPLHEPAAPRAVMSAAHLFWIWTTPCDEAGATSVGGWAGATPVLEGLDVAAGPGRWLELVEELAPDLRLDRDGARLTVWERDPWARGAYSVLPPEATAAAVASAIGPGPNVVFAGEHTAEPGWTGTMEGALRSGRRAALDLDASLGL
jgi:monoamine oxidase